MKITSHLESSEKYAEALKIYATTSETLKSIAKRLELVYNSIGNYVRRNHPEVIEQHNALLVSTEERFAQGVEILHTTKKTISAVMKELGYSEHFRTYVKEYYPELMKRTAVSNACADMSAKQRKYDEAIQQLETTSDTMKVIAGCLELNYASLHYYTHKHYPKVLKGRQRKRHKSDNKHSKE